MKKIIAGRLYDTDKAEEIAKFDNDYWKTDYHWYEETLYKTDKGNYFLYGQGGALTKYRYHCADGYTAGEDITPLTLEEAKEWGEAHMNPDYYMDEFGEVEQA